MKMAARN